MVHRVQSRLLGIEIAAGLGKYDLQGIDSWCDADLNEAAVRSQQNGEAGPPASGTFP